MFSGEVQDAQTSVRFTDGADMGFHTDDQNDQTPPCLCENPNCFPAGWTRWTYDPQRHFLILHLSARATPAQRYLVRMRYTGPLADDLAGLYRSSYTTESGETRSGLRLHLWRKDSEDISVALGFFRTWPRLVLVLQTFNFHAHTRRHVTRST